jgi:hypothetical protein
MFPIRLMIGAVVLLIITALTPLLWEAFGERPVQTVDLNSTNNSRFARTAPLIADSRQQPAAASASPDVRSQAETERLSPGVTGSVPQAPAPEVLPQSKTVDPFPAIKLPIPPHAASSKAKVKRARRPAAAQKIASRQVQNSLQFGPQQPKLASPELKPVPLPPPNFSNSGY